MSESTQPGLCVLLREESRALPALSAEQTLRYLREHMRQYEGLLALARTITLCRANYAGKQWSSSSMSRVLRRRWLG